MSANIPADSDTPPPPCATDTLAANQSAAPAAPPSQDPHAGGTPQAPLPAPPVGRLQVASMTAATVALCSHIVFGGTAVQRAERQGLAYAILVAASLGLLLDAVAVGFAIHARRLRQRATPDVAAAERWEEVGEYVLLSLVTVVAIVSAMVAIYQAIRD